MLTLKLITEQTERVISGLEKKHFQGAREAINEVLAIDSQRRDADFHAYYFQVLNIQIDTYIATGDLPMLPDFKLNPSYFEGSAKLKVILFNILGVKKLCKLISFFKRL